MILTFLTCSYRKEKFNESILDQFTCKGLKIIVALLTNIKWEKQIFNRAKMSIKKENITFLFWNGPDCIKAIWKSRAEIQIEFQTFLFLVKSLLSWNGSLVHLKPFWAENISFRSYY